MAYSLLAHLYPRIRGSQEDIATFSLAYILEQSTVLNEAFTRLARNKLHLQLNDTLLYHCQDADQEYGRPDIAGYSDGQLCILCEAKFYAGLTANQPVSYIKRLQTDEGKTRGLLFLCPKARIVSLWDKICQLAKAEMCETVIEEYCNSYNGVHVSIIPWGELLSELLKVSMEQDPERLGDLQQLQGFYEEIENESFMPFRPEELSAQTARDIDRYYQVVDETYRILLTHKELDPNVKGLRKAPRWQGYSQYIVLGNIAVSVDFLRKPWKASTSIETPFWCHLSEIIDGKWVITEKVLKFMSTIERREQEEFYGTQYLALKPKPYFTLSEVAEDLADQIIKILRRFQELE